MSNREYPYCAKIAGNIAFYGTNLDAICKRLQKWWKEFYKNNSKNSYLAGENGIYFLNYTKEYERIEDIDSCGKPY